MYYQQGDILIKRKEIPARAKKIEHLVIAEGEATGHRHEVFGLAKLMQLDEKVFLDVFGEAEVRHQEHESIPLPIGEYEIEIVRKYDHFEEEARRVVD